MRAAVTMCLAASTSFAQEHITSKSFHYINPWCVLQAPIATGPSLVQHFQCSFGTPGAIRTGRTHQIDALHSTNLWDIFFSLVWDLQKHTVSNARLTRVHTPTSILHSLFTVILQSCFHSMLPAWLDKLVSCQLPINTCPKLGCIYNRITCMHACMHERWQWQSRWRWRERGRERERERVREREREKNIKMERCMYDTFHIM